MLSESKSETLPDLLVNAAATWPEHGIGFILPDRSQDFLPFPELYKRSLSFLAGLQKKGLCPSDLLIISLDKSSEIIPVLWACFIGGIVPALLQPPVTFTEYNPAAEKADKVFRKLKSARVILSHRHLNSWRESSVPANRLIDISGLESDPALARPAVRHPDDLALIQFSSGSTGDPKGVMLTHRNILVNISDIIEGIRLRPEDVAVNWMPLFHDMGLIGFHITPLKACVSQYFIDPAEFVKNPMLWLETLSRKKCTITGCPNFGQVLVNRFLKRRTPQGSDFSSLRVIFNGAEPISVPTMNDFLGGLRSFGLRPEAMFPAYGMAEATLAVTFPPLFSGAEVRRFDRIVLIREGKAVEAGPETGNIIELVNLGKAIGSSGFRILGEDDREQPEGVVGYVVVAGKNITPGYYNDPDASLQSFYDGWLRTGDLGFRLGGDLFITGRAKDIIFVNGINFYAHDLESIAHQLEAVNYGKIVIAGYFDEQESRDKLIIFLAGPDSPATREIMVRIKMHFLKTLGLATDIYIPVRSNEIPRTSSGKIQRYRMVGRFLRGEFETVIRI